MTAGGKTRRRGPGRPRLDQPSEEYLERLSAIVDTAARVFQDKGYHAASLDLIAESLDLRKSSLYHYVGSKADLLRLVFDRMLTVALERFEAIEKIQDPRERLQALIEHQVFTIVSHPAYYAVFFDQRAYLGDEQMATLREKERRYVRVYEEAVRDAVEADVLPAVDARLAAHAILGMTSWIYKWFRPDRHDARDFAEVCTRLVLRTFEQDGAET